MNQENPAQSAPTKRDVIPWLVRNGKLKVGDPLGCVVKGEFKRGLQKKKDQDGKAVFIVGITVRLGIQCGCGCQRILAMSMFEEHAGSNQKRGSGVIFCMDGSLKSLRDLLDEPELSAISIPVEGGAESSQSQSEGRRTFQQNTRTCDFCLLTEGNVICCTTPSCPTSSHAQCSGMQEFFQEFPNGKWCCLKCTCSVCDLPLEFSPTKVGAFTNVHCALCGEQYHGDCIGQIRSLHRQQHFDENMKWVCSDFCAKTYELMEGRVKKSLHASNPDELSLVRWTGLYNTSDQELIPEQVKLKQKATEVEKLFDIFCVLRNSFPWDQNLGGNNTVRLENILYPLDPHDQRRHTIDFRCLDQYGFYSVFLENKTNGKLLTVATIRIHSGQVAEMPFITTSEAHRREGNCTDFMEHLEKMLKDLGVKTLIVQSPPEFVAMWSSICSVHPADVDALRSLLTCNLLKIEGRTLLCKKIE